MADRDLLRRLPAVGRLLESDAGAELAGRYSRELAKLAVQGAIDEARQAILEGQQRVPADAEILRRAAELIRSRLGGLQPVINATGVILHTNLGRAPLSPLAIRAIADAASGYCNLEMDIETGERSKRHAHVEWLLCELTGAEAALVVNNNAAAVLLTLRELACGRKVVVSRGQLIEIGGAFRLPDVMAQSGCRLVEVGTTNRTRLDDYARAIDEETAAILVAHHSNYRIVGFTYEPPLAEIAELARERGVLLIHDLGSGAIVDLSQWGLEREPMAQESLRAGADIVCFSGDKLLGGPQAGIILGREELVDRIARNPLARALRVDKLCLAALHATLLSYLGGRAAEEVPALRMLTEDLESVRQRALRVYDAITSARPKPQARLEQVEGRAGGGSLPEYDLPSVAVRVWPPEGLSPDEFARRLRLGEPPVIARISDDSLLFDARTVFDHQVEQLAQAILAALGTSQQRE